MTYSLPKGQRPTGHRTIIQFLNPDYPITPHSLDQAGLKSKVHLPLPLKSSDQRQVLPQPGILLRQGLYLQTCQVVKKSCLYPPAYTPQVLRIKKSTAMPGKMLKTKFETIYLMSLFSGGDLNTVHNGVTFNWLQSLPFDLTTVVIQWMYFGCWGKITFQKALFFS